MSNRQPIWGVQYGFIIAPGRDMTVNSTFWTLNLITGVLVCFDFYPQRETYYISFVLLCCFWLLFCFSLHLGGVGKTYPRVFLAPPAHFSCYVIVFIPKHIPYFSTVLLELLCSLSYMYMFTLADEKWYMHIFISVLRQREMCGNSTITLLHTRISNEVSSSK